MEATEGHAIVAIFYAVVLIAFLVTLVASRDG